MGSPLYASPEQIRASSHVDGRADIWALGAVAYTMLTGRPPFEASTFSELCVRIAQARAEPIDRSRPDVPPGLAAVIGRCLAKDPSARFQTVAELASALAPFASPRAMITVERIASLAPVTPALLPLSATLRSARDGPSEPEAASPTHAAGALRWAVVGAVLAIVALLVLLASRGADRVASVGPSSIPPRARPLSADAGEMATTPAPVDPAVPVSAPLEPVSSEREEPPAAPPGRPRQSRTSGFGGLL
jgi:eukaryotic-like serine/threonine-protein kinase